MNTNRCFEILEISPDATCEEAKAAYRLMCQVWHPDKYTHSEQLYAKATSKIKEINAAWSQIEDYFKNVAAKETVAREAEQKARTENEKKQKAERKDREQKDKHITCPSCKTSNRLPFERSIQNAKCGVCGQNLFSQNKESKEQYERQQEKYEANINDKYKDEILSGDEIAKRFFVVIGIIGGFIVFLFALSGS